MDISVSKTFYAWLLEEKTQNLIIKDNNQSLKTYRLMEKKKHLNTFRMSGCYVPQWILRTKWNFYIFGARNIPGISTYLAVCIICSNISCNKIRTNPLIFRLLFLAKCQVSCIVHPDIWRGNYNIQMGLSPNVTFCQKILHSCMWQKSYQIKVWKLFK